jgi:hypothetical protein
VSALRPLLRECFTPEYYCLADAIAEHIASNGHLDVDAWTTWVALQLDATSCAAGRCDCDATFCELHADA